MYILHLELFEAFEIVNIQNTFGKHIMLVCYDSCYLYVNKGPLFVYVSLIFIGLFKIFKLTLSSTIVFDLLCWLYRWIDLFSSLQIVFRIFILSLHFAVKTQWNSLQHMFSLICFYMTGCVINVFEKSSFYLQSVASWISGSHEATKSLHKHRP